MHTSIVWLLQGVPLTREYADVLVFASASAQQEYFTSKRKYAFQDLMYIRETELYIPDQAGNYRDCNYLMYTNPDYPNKWFYGFITSVEYIADGTTKISYMEDFFQTWYFEMSVKQCLVNREHVNDDTIGKHLKDEGLALGDYVYEVRGETDFTPYWIVVISSQQVIMYDKPTPAEGTIIGNVYTGLEYTAYPPEYIDVIQLILDKFADRGASDAIVSMYMLPKKALPETYRNGQPLPTRMETGVIGSIMPNNLDGYTPKNNKLLTYPYCALQITNNSGQQVNLRYEFFEDGPFFDYMISSLPNGRVIICPHKYKGKLKNYDYAIALGDYPQCAWIKDVYSNWLATQSIRWGYQIENIKKETAYAGIKQSVMAGVGALTGNWEQFGAGLGGSINELIGMNQELESARQNMAMESHIHAMTPGAVQGTIGNDNTLATVGECKITTASVTITAEYAKSIDNYFSMFGYRVDEVKTPNIFGRKSWNYVQTTGAIVTGNCPVYATDGFKKLLDRGVRFWHTPDIGNYSLPNGRG